MDGLRVMQADIENMHTNATRSTGKGLGLGGAGGGAAGKTQGATPLRRRALGDITNSKANSSTKQNTPSSKQGAAKGSKVEAKVAMAPTTLPQNAHTDDIEAATRFASEEAFFDSALDEGLDALLNASGPAEVCSRKPMLSASLLHRPVKFEAAPSHVRGLDEEELMDIDLEDDMDNPFENIGDCIEVVID